MIAKDGRKQPVCHTSTLAQQSKLPVHHGSRGSIETAKHSDNGPAELGCRADEIYQPLASNLEINSLLAPEVQPERGRSMTRQCSKPQTGSERRTVSKQSRSPLRTMSAHAGIHFLSVVRSDTTSPVQAEQTEVHKAVPPEIVCKFSYEDHKHVQTISWLNLKGQNE